MSLSAKDRIYAGDLLLFAKTNVRNLAIAITETATPGVRVTLTQALNEAIQFHGAVFQYMSANGIYPAYDLPATLQSDLKNATIALNMPIKTRNY